MTMQPPRIWRVRDRALVHHKQVSVRGSIDHGGPEPFDEVLVEIVASGEERVVPRDALMVSTTPWISPAVSSSAASSQTAKKPGRRVAAPRGGCGRPPPGAGVPDARRR